MVSQEKPRKYLQLTSPSQNNTSRGVPWTTVCICICSQSHWTLYSSSKTAHPIDIFSLAVTGNQILSASGASSLKVHSTADPDFPLVQSIDNAHNVGCHHVVTSRQGSRAVSAGFGGEIKIWSCQNGHWSEDASVSGMAP